VRLGTGFGSLKKRGGGALDFETTMLILSLSWSTDSYSSSGKVMSDASSAPILSALRFSAAK